MKKQNLGLVSLLLTLPLLISANTSHETGYWNGFTLGPIYRDVDYSFTIRFDNLESSTSYHEFSLFISNERTKGLIYTYGDITNEDMYAPLYHKRHTFTGIESVSYSLTIPGGYIGDNNVFTFWNKQSDCNYGALTVLKTVPVFPSGGQDVSLVSSFKGLNTSVCSNGKFDVNWPVISFKGFEKSYDAAAGNRVPLEKMVFSSFDTYDNVYLPLDDSKLKLIITGVEARTFYHMNNGVAIHRNLFTIDLDFIPGEKEGEYVVALPPRKYVIDPISGIESNYVPQKGGVVTRNLYLPQQASSVKTYNMKIENSSSDIYGKYYAEFTVTADHNLFGNCTNSDWCVGME